MTVLTPEESEATKSNLPWMGTLDEPDVKGYQLTPEESSRSREPDYTLPFSFDKKTGEIGPSKETVEKQKISRDKKVKELTAAIGKEYDPDYDFGDNESVLLDYGKATRAQADLARSLSLEDKQRKWRELYYPEGDLISVNTSDGQVLLGRKNKNEPFREIGFGETILGSVVSEPVILGGIGSIAGPHGTALATAAGVLAQSGIEQLRGYDTDQPDSIDALIEGGIAGGVDIIFRGFGRLIRGRSRTPGQAKALRDAIAANAELGLEPIAVGQISGPFLRGT